MCNIINLMKFNLLIRRVYLKDTKMMKNELKYIYFNSS